MVPCRDLDDIPPAHKDLTRRFIELLNSLVRMTTDQEEEQGHPPSWTIMWNDAVNAHIHWAAHTAFEVHVAFMEEVGVDRRKFFTVFMEGLMHYSYARDWWRTIKSDLSDNKN